MDLELELQIELLRETKRKYESVLQLGRALTAHLYSLLQTQHALGDAFADLSQKSPELQVPQPEQRGWGDWAPALPGSHSSASLPPSCSPQGEPLQGGPSPAPSSTHLWRQPKGLYRGPEVGGVGWGRGHTRCLTSNPSLHGKNAFGARSNQSPSPACCTSSPCSCLINLSEKPLPPHSYPRHPQDCSTNFLAKRPLLEEVLGCFSFDGCFLFGKGGNEGFYSSNEVATVTQGLYLPSALRKNLATMQRPRNCYARMGRRF